jgi:DNA-directed RNA polymerase specialized sigma24 family protein
MSNLQQLYDNYAPQMYAVALRILHDQKTAEDILVQAFVAWTRSEEQEPARLLRLTRDLALLRVRKKRITPVAEVTPQKLLELVFFEGFTIAELAESCSLSAAEVRNLLVSEVARMRTSRVSLPA